MKMQPGDAGGEGGGTWTALVGLADFGKNHNDDYYNNHDDYFGQYR
jgi:hypothetical protein